MDNAGNMYIADGLNYRVRKISSSGVINTIAGIGTTGYSGDGHAATLASINFPLGLCLDNNGNVYFSDGSNNHIRKISDSGIITTIAGTGFAGYSGEGVLATASKINEPDGLFFDKSGNLFIAEYTSYRVSEIVTCPAESSDLIIGSSAVCIGSSTAFTKSYYGGTWSIKNSNANISAGIVTGVTAGVDTVQYTITNGCGTIVTSKVITVVANPLAASTGTMIVCAGNTTTLLNTTSGGTWTSSNTSLATIGSTTGIVSGVAAGTDYITYTLSSGCYKTSSVSVGTPITTAISGTLSVCAGGSHTTLADATTGGAWTSGTTSVATVGSTGIVSGVAAGTATISYTKAGCYVTRPVTVNANPLAANTGTMVVCAGNTTTLSNTTSGGTWTSSIPADATVGSSTGIVTGVAAGVPIITYALSTGCYKASGVTVGAP